MYIRVVQYNVRRTHSVYIAALLLFGACCCCCYSFAKHDEDEDCDMRYENLANIAFFCCCSHSQFNLIEMNVFHNNFVARDCGTDIVRSNISSIECEEEYMVGTRICAFTSMSALTATTVAWACKYSVTLNERNHRLLMTDLFNLF